MSEELENLPHWLKTSPEQKLLSFLFQDTEEWNPEQTHQDWVRACLAIYGCKDDWAKQRLSNTDYTETLEDLPTRHTIQRFLLHLSTKHLEKMAHYLEHARRDKEMEAPKTVVEGMLQTAELQAQQWDKFLRETAANPELGKYDLSTAVRLLDNGINIYNAKCSPDSLFQNTRHKAMKQDILEALRETMPEAICPPTTLDTLVKQGLILKPKQGARAQLVMKLTYNGRLRVTSKDELVHAILRESARADNFERAYKLSEIMLETDEVPSDNKKLTDRLMLDIMPHSVAIEGEGLRVQISKEYDSDDVYNGVDVEPEMDLPLATEGTDYTEFEAEAEELPHFVEEIKKVYRLIGKEHYAEPCITTPLFQGNIWEIRVICQSPDLDTSHCTAMYCKVGDGDAISNISTGGRGLPAEEVVKDAYSQLEGDGTEYLAQVKELAERAANTLTEYLTARKDERKKDFCMPRITAADLAIDFMGQTDGKKLVPKIIDINFHYGMSGLDEETQHTVWKNRAKIYAHTRRILNQPSTKQPQQDTA